MRKQPLCCSNISMINSALLALCVVFLSITHGIEAAGRGIRPHVDDVSNTTSTAAALLGSTTTNPNDVQGLMTLITAFPLLAGNPFPYLSSDPCYSQKLIWIRCSNDNVRRVTALYVGVQYLVGNLPDFSSMDALQTIDFHRNALFGPIPEFLGTFPQLTYLDLSYNLFSGPLPDSLVNNKKIKLNLAGNPLQLSPPTTPTIRFPPPVITAYAPPTPPAQSRSPSGGGGSGGGGSNLPNIGRRKKSKLPKILKITIPTGFISTVLGVVTCGVCRRRRRLRNQSDEAAGPGPTAHAVG